MNFIYDSETRTFLLHNAKMAYAFYAAADGRLVHLYWGAPLSRTDDLNEIRFMEERQQIEKSILPPTSEYRTNEPFDYGDPCLRVRFSDGAETLRLRYQSHEFRSGTLTVHLKDAYYPLEVALVYRTWDALPLITRSAVITNTGASPVTLLSAKSAVAQLPHGREWRLTHFSGNWGAEYRQNQLMLTQSRVVLENSRLTAAAAQQVPFFALDEDGRSTETNGEVFFGALHWSGDFQITAETQYMHETSVTGGINNTTAQIPLAAGEPYTTPEFTLGFSTRGFAQMSEILYDWQYDYLLPRGCKTDKAHAERPIIYNSWYPYEFNVDEEHLVALIPKAKYIGAELFVIDDGWMKGRIHDHAGLGDWFVDEERFPHGLGYLADECHRQGMDFGLWVEPEMANPDSDLYRAHPDWILSEKNREQSLQRNQCVLDFSRDDIRDWAIDWLDQLITSAKLDYLKWDMNRYATEIGLFALEKGIPEKYMRNIRAIWQHLNEKFPDVLFENCASGGGRADFGMVEFADRINRSDNADPVDVMLLHEGFSTLFVPKSAGGAGNISPSPNGINNRTIPLDFRIHCGMTGSMSVGINLLKSPAEELEQLRTAIAAYKQLRPALHDSYVYRLASALAHPYSVLEYCKRDRSQFTVFAFGHGMRIWDRTSGRSRVLFRMQGLIPDAVYECDSIRMTGAALMQIGLLIPLVGDYASAVMTFRKISG